MGDGRRPRQRRRHGRDERLHDGYGSVAYAYRISKYEVTNAQYAEFLNAVASSDDFAGLYDAQMSGPQGGIAQNDLSGGFSYSAKPGLEQMPVNFVSITDAAYFANWLNNGQPVQPPDDPPLSTIRDGAYDVFLNPTGFSRNPDASVFLPNENEWYKAAYYDALSSSYFLLPTSSNSQTSCTGPTAAPNSANCDDLQPPPGDLVPVGSYPGSPSPYGTFDQGGNVWEWNETLFNSSDRGQRGGGFDQGYGYMVSGARYFGSAGQGASWLGFRVAEAVPEPGTGLLLWLGLVGFAGWRRSIG
jgi:formylglycine-generating enzyme required for sulfatase activity